MPEEKEKRITDHTMANCPVDEFMKTAYAIREEVEEFVKATEIVKIRAEKPDYSGAETDEEKAAIESKTIRDKWSKILGAAFGENREQSISLMAKMCFTTEEEINKLQPYELNNLALLLLSSSRINDFFTSLQLWGLFDSGST